MKVTVANHNENWSFWWLKFEIFLNRSLDLLGSILQQELGRSGFQMHRTKCIALVRKILGPHFIQELRLDIKNTPFSLLLDESTDVSTTKLLGISIKYYSQSEKKIVSTFLTLVKVDQSDAIGLSDQVQ